MRNNPSLLLNDIIEAASEIAKYTQAVNQETFVHDTMRYNATIRMIAIIGEAISNLESNFKDQYPQIPWQQIKDMRNILIHEYWQTDLDQVYLSATKEIPELMQLTTTILHDLESQNPQSPNQ